MEDKETNEQIEHSEKQAEEPAEKETEGKKEQSGNDLQFKGGAVMQNKHISLIFLNSIASIVIIIISYYMISGGYRDYAATTGRVYGSSFGMLITIVNELSLIMLWLAVMGLTIVFNLLLKNIFDAAAATNKSEIENASAGN